MAPPPLSHQSTGLSRHRKAEFVPALHVNGIEYEHGKREDIGGGVMLPLTVKVLVRIYQLKSAGPQVRVSYAIHCVPYPYLKLWPP